MGKYPSPKARNVGCIIVENMRSQSQTLKINFHAKPLLRERNLLSVYETNIFQTLSFMFNCNTKLFFHTYRPKATNKYTLRSIGTLLLKYTIEE